MADQPTPPSVKPEVVFIEELLEELKQGTVRIPNFQRPFVWRPHQVRDLLDSIRKGYPIGSILLWDTEESISTLDKVGPVSVEPLREGPFACVLDGQQRLTSLLGALTGSLTSQAPDSMWQVWYNLQTREFVHIKAATVCPQEEMKPGPELFPVMKMMDTYPFLDECQRIREECKAQKIPEKAADYIREAQQVANTFKKYKLPVIRIKNATLADTVDTFARLNTKGTPLTADEMVSALSYKEGSFSLAKRIDTLTEQLADQNFGGTNRVILFRAVLAALDQDVYRTDWNKLVTEFGDKMAGAVDACEKSLALAVEFLKSIGVLCDRLLPYSLQLVMLSEFFRLNPEPLQQQVGTLARMFWVTSFTGWFASGNSTQIQLALKQVRQLARKERVGLDFLDMDQAASPFPSRFDIRSARVRAFLAFLTALAPLDLTTGTKLDIGDVLVSDGHSALVYIARAPDQVSREWGAHPANRMLLGRRNRKQLRRRLLDLDSAKRDEILMSHGIAPGAYAELKANNIEAFLQQRATFLMQEERAFMRKRQVTLPRDEGTAEPQLDSDVDDGEP